MNSCISFYIFILEIIKKGWIHIKNLEKNYITDRVDERIKYFSKEGKKQGNFYKFFKLIEILAGFKISIICSFTPDYNNLKIMAVALSSVGLICEGIIDLYKYKDNWIDYRRTAELLKREKYLYQSKSDIYKEADNTLNIFIEKCEDIISKSTVSWINSQLKEIDMKFYSNSLAR